MPLLINIPRRRPADWLLAAEAFLLLAIFRIALRLVPVRTILRTVTRGRTPTHGPADARPPEILPSHQAVAERVRWAVEAVTRNAAARFVCFPQTLAGYTMLRLRHVASTMVYGVTRSPQGHLIAHTWLTVGDRIVLGGNGSGGFSVVDRWT